MARIPIPERALNAIAITRIEGGQPSAYCLAQLALFEAGEVFAAELRERANRNARD